MFSLRAVPVQLGSTCAASLRIARSPQALEIDPQNGEIDCGVTARPLPQDPDTSHPQMVSSGAERG